MTSEARTAWTKASAAAEDNQRENRIVKEKKRGRRRVLGGSNDREGFIGAQVSTCHQSYICSALF